MKNPRRINETSAILVDRDDDSGQIYLEAGHPDFEAAAAGGFGVVAPFASPTQEELDVALAASVREERNAALAATDYVGLADYPAKAGELEYRQALRDVPQQASFPKTHTWPNKP